MGKIIAIGGGEMGRPRGNGDFYPIETLSIDKEILFQTGKKNPKLLFLGTASTDPKGYFSVVHHYFSKLGADVSNLCLQTDNLSFDQIKNTILQADAVYVGGGNTLRLMTIWRKLGVDSILSMAYEKGVILSGISAGAICWFSYGNSDSRKFTSGSNSLIKVRGLGFINALHCPHYNEVARQTDLKRMMKSTHKILSIALEDCTALELIDDQYRILQSKADAKAYKIYWQRGRFIKMEIPIMESFQPIASLLQK